MSARPVPTCGHPGGCPSRATHRSAKPVAVGGGNFTIPRRCAPHATDGMVLTYPPPAHDRRAHRPLHPTLFP